MRFRSIYQPLMALFLIATISFGCKQNTEGSNDEASKSNVEISSEEQSLRNTALNLINHRSQDGKTYAFMTAGFWNYEFVFDKVMSKPGDYNGHWLRFADDFTYSYGLFEEVTGGGRYHYDFDTNMLIMLDNDATIQPKEWEVKYGGEAMVFVGSHGFGNNGMQIKFMQTEQQPTR